MIVLDILQPNAKKNYSNNRNRSYSNIKYGNYSKIHITETTTTDIAKLQILIELKIITTKTDPEFILSHHVELIYSTQIDKIKTKEAVRLNIIDR